MDEDTEVLDWENGDEFHHSSEAQPNYTAQDDDDRVSLGGDDEDEEEYYDSRNVGPATAQPAPEAEQFKLVQQEEPSAETKAPQAETAHSSQTQVSASPKSPVAEIFKVNPPLVHALPPKPVSAMVVKRRDIPSTTAATSMRIPSAKELPLPPDWEVRKSRSGAGNYYYNVRTFETSWNRPTHDAKPARTTSDFRGPDAKGPDERISNGTRTRRPPVDIAAPEEMTYEDRHYRPGESVDDNKDLNIPNRSRTPPNQRSSEDLRRPGRGSRRASSLERSSANLRSHARDTRDSNGRGPTNSRDEPARGRQTWDSSPSRNDSQRSTDTYIPPAHEPRSKGRADDVQMRSGSPPVQQSTKSRPRSPDLYPPIQTRPAQTSGRKREGRSSRFSQAAPSSQNGPVQTAPVAISVLTNDVDPYVPDDIAAPPKEYLQNPQDSYVGTASRTSPDIGGRDAYGPEPPLSQSDHQPQVTQDSSLPKRPPLPPQAQSFHKSRQAPRQRPSRSVSPRSSTKRNEKRPASPPPASVQRAEPYEELRPSDERPVDSNSNQAPRGPRYMIENNGVDRDRSTLPPPSAPTGPAGFGDRKRRNRDEPLMGAPPTAVPRTQGKFSAPSATPSRFNDKLAISGPNSTPLPNLRRFGPGQAPAAPRSDYPPAGFHSSDDLPVRQRENRHADLPPPPTSYYDDGARLGPPRRERRASLSDRYSDRRPSVSTSISAGPLMRRDIAPHPPYDHDSDSISPSDHPLRPSPSSQEYDQYYEPERDRGRVDQDERAFAEREQRADYRDEDRYWRPEQQRSSYPDRYEPPRARDIEDGARYRNSERDQHWSAQSQESSNRLPAHPSRAKLLPPTDLPRSQDGNRPPRAREWGGREQERDRNMGSSDIDTAPRTTSLLERMHLTEPGIGVVTPLQDHVHVPAKRERESGRPHEDEEMAKRRRRNGRRSGGRRAQVSSTA